ncbi:hypothetical protein BUALT_Bualt02G0076300 [Buddleja alternifolia]|uniref:Zinc finger BED domain-containing protein RICESLEEPER 2-like n=1 Tax=Buddleja alternifolia TaxID=168488 RepID=A0AAV6Y8X5_9LAMI|nr:hypothetical protein BUALT_Bualt02G0076300 [Buddleja alternifolia]
MSTSYNESSQARDSGVNEEIIIETQKTKRKASAIWDHFTKLKGASPRTTFKFDQMKSRRKLAISCIKHKFPFNIGEHEHFEDFLSSLNPNFQLPCRNTIRSDVIDVYREEKVKPILSMMNGNCRKKILSFKKIPYPHDGDNLFNFMKENILEWNLDKKIFSVVVDNASSNDSMMRKLREWLLKDSLIPLNENLLHVRCSAHVLNLIVQDGLSPIRGLIEKIRETMRYLNKSPSATQKFDTALRHCNLEGKRKVSMDVPNRWNSTYLLLETALPLKEAFLVFDPRLKMKMVEFYYKKLYGSYADSYIERVRDTLLELFIAYGGSCATQSTIPSGINLETSTSLSEFYMWCNETNASVIPKSELDSYLEEASFQSVEDFSILNWWRTNSLRLPIMAKIAFSVGGRVIDESCACLHPTVVEALVVADDWIKSTPRNGNGIGWKLCETFCFLRRLVVPQSSADED